MRAKWIPALAGMTNAPSCAAMTDACFKRVVVSLFVSVAAFVGSSDARAQSASDYPSRPIRLVVPFVAGGSTDIVARVIGQKLAEQWGKQVVVDNRAGANGVIGMEIVARAAPDGHTLVLGYIANLGTAQALNPKLPYDPVKDYAPISHIVSAPSIGALHPAVQAKNLQELVALARAKPEAISFGTAAVGSMGHLTGELINRMANVKMQHVPYKGGGQAVTDAVSGQIPLIIIGMTAATPHIRAGRLRAVFTTGLKRSFAFPEVPTVAEQGFPGFSTDAWYGLLAPARTPRAIVDKVNAAVTRATQLPDVKQRMADVGFEIVAGSPDEFAKLIREEILKWNRVIKDAAIKGE